jgi:hypothetical protein
VHNSRAASISLDQAEEALESKKAYSLAIAMTEDVPSLCASTPLELNQLPFPKLSATTIIGWIEAPGIELIV